MLRTHRAGKGPGGCGRWGLGLRNRRGPGMPPIPCLRGWGTSSGSPAGLLGLSGGANALCSSPTPPGGSSHLPLLISPASLLCLQGPMRPGGGFGGQETDLGAQQVPWPEWVGQLPSAPLPVLPEGPSHLSPWSQGCPSCLASTSPHLSVPPRPTGSLGGSSYLLGRQGPQPVTSMCPSCGETLTRHLPTLPS